MQIGRQRGPIEPRARQSTAPGVGLDQNISVCSNLLVVDGVDEGEVMKARVVVSSDRPTQRASACVHATLDVALRKRLTHPPFSF